MNKKLPDINKIKNKIITNNKKMYYSSYDERQENKNNDVVEDILKEKNFFKYFNRSVEITLLDGSVVKTKILSKINNKILLEDGSYLEVDKIKNIK